MVRRMPSVKYRFTYVCAHFLRRICSYNAINAAYSKFLVFTSDNAHKVMPEHAQQDNISPRKKNPSEIWVLKAVSLEPGSYQTF